MALRIEDLERESLYRRYVEALEPLRRAGGAGAVAGPRDPPLPHVRRTHHVHASTPRARGTSAPAASTTPDPASLTGTGRPRLVVRPGS